MLFPSPPKAGFAEPWQKATVCAAVLWDLGMSSLLPVSLAAQGIAVPLGRSLGEIFTFILVFL